MKIKTLSIFIILILVLSIFFMSITSSFAVVNYTIGNNIYNKSIFLSSYVPVGSSSSNSFVYTNLKFTCNGYDFKGVKHQSGRGTNFYIQAAESVTIGGTSYSSGDWILIRGATGFIDSSFSRLVFDLDSGLDAWSSTIYSDLSSAGTFTFNNSFTSLIGNKFKVNSRIDNDSFKMMDGIALPYEGTLYFFDGTSYSFKSVIFYHKVIGDYTYPILRFKKSAFSSYWVNAYNSQSFSSEDNLADQIPQSSMINFSLSSLNTSLSYTSESLTNFNRFFYYYFSLSTQAAQEEESITPGEGDQSDTPTTQSLFNKVISVLTSFFNEAIDFIGHVVSESASFISSLTSLISWVPEDVQTALYGAMIATTFVGFIKFLK